MPDRQMGRKADRWTDSEFSRLLSLQHKTEPTLPPTSHNPMIIPLTRWLELWVKRVDVHREVEVTVYGYHGVAMELVGLVDALRVPVCPVELVLEEGQCKRMGQPCKYFARYILLPLYLPQ